MKKYRLKEEVKKYYPTSLHDFEKDPEWWGSNYALLLEALKEVEEDILVPDCIKIGVHDRSGAASIIFNKGKQELGFCEDTGVYEIDPYPYKSKPCKLVKCNREDLKPGDVAYRHGHFSITEGSCDFYNYCIILSKTKQVYISEDEKDIYVESTTYDTWYKVVPLNN